MRRVGGKESKENISYLLETSRWLMDIQAAAYQVAGCVYISHVCIHICYVYIYMGGVCVCVCMVAQR